MGGSITWRSVGQFHDAAWVNYVTRNSNRPYQEWGAIFASPTIATAVLDRLLHHVTTLSLRGDSYRLKGGIPSPPPTAPVAS